VTAVHLRPQQQVTHQLQEHGGFAGTRFAHDQQGAFGLVVDGGDGGADGQGGVEQLTRQEVVGLVPV